MNYNRGNMYLKASEKSKEEYKQILKAIGSLSYLFSESDNIYLNYRVHENSYCEAFEATNLSRSDIAIDAEKDKVGIGLKTFLRGNNKTYQKIAEFNKLSNLLQGKNSIESVNLIKEWRNERLRTSVKLYELESLIYHCIIRDSKGFHVFEEEMDFIDDVENIEENEKSIKFKSNDVEYTFNKSKNTLLKKFNTDKILDTYEVEVLSNPFDFLKTYNFIKNENNINELEEISLPLYSERSGEVHKKSGLNQWNASGRKRNPNEIYIPISSSIRRENPNFFPRRDVKFDVLLPNGKEISCKVCQEGGKALMSNPNKDLGEWLLRDVLNLEEGTLLSRKILQVKGFDRILISKIGPLKYKLDVHLEK